MILHTTCQILINYTYEQLLALATAIGTFENSSPSPVKFWFDTDSTEWRELVPRQRIGDCSEIHVLRWWLCALLLSSHHSFPFAEWISFGCCGSEHEHYASVFVSPLLKLHLPNLSSLFQRNVRAHAPPGPPDYLWRAVTKQECLALDLPCSSRLRTHGSPWPACHDLSAPVSRMHTCHFRSALDLTMVPIKLILWSRCWRQNASGIWWPSENNET